MCVAFSGILTGWLKTQLSSLSDTISFITRALNLVDYKINVKHCICVCILKPIPLIAAIYYYVHYSDISE